MAKLVLAGRDREVVDERRRRGETGVEAVLDGAVGNRDGEMSLASAAGAAGDEAVALRDQLGTEDAAER
jgi:hypothetical protein